MLNQITILAPGLLGASLAMAIRREQLAERLHIWARRPETRLECEGMDWCDAVFATAEEAVKNASLVVMCTPVETLHRLARRIAGSVPEGCIVTDVGSTKSLVCRYCDAFLPDSVTFVGSHPMAGSEKSGMAHARADLFEGRPCFVTPLEDTPGAAVETLVRFWKALGMRPLTTSPERHDEIVANISHLPHIVASLLCQHLSTRESDWRNFAGQGLADTTRVAAGNPALWREIIEQNRDEILRALDGFENELHTFRSALANEQYFEILHRLQNAKIYRDAFPGQGLSS